MKPPLRSTRNSTIRYTVNTVIVHQNRTERSSVQIQRTIREEFVGAIVITIAHRLKTVLDYDRILVLGGGEILEFDTPDTLIRKSGGVFREMCRASADWRMLREIAVSRRNSSA